MNKILNIDPTVDPLWLKLVTQQKSDVFHSPGWLKVLQETYNFDLRALVLTEANGEPRSGMAYCKIEDMMDPRIASLPFSDFCDPLVNDEADWKTLILSLIHI